MSGWCCASLNLTSEAPDVLLTCQRDGHDEGLHHHTDGEGRDIWWYSPTWMPEVPIGLLEKGGSPCG